MGRKAYGPKKKKAHDLHHVKKKRKSSGAISTPEYGKLTHTRVQI